MLQQLAQLFQRKHPRRTTQWPNCEHSWTCLLTGPYCLPSTGDERSQEIQIVLVKVWLLLCISSPMAYPSDKLFVPSSLFCISLPNALFYIVSHLSFHRLELVVCPGHPLAACPSLVNMLQFHLWNLWLRRSEPAPSHPNDHIASETPGTRWKQKE